MLHYRQMTNCTCGAAAYRMMVSQWELISEKTAVDEVHTTKSGTSTLNVVAALKKRGIDCNLFQLNTDFGEYSRWLALNSVKRILYMHGEFVNKKVRKHRHHAFVVSDGFIYDPSEPNPLPIEAFFDRFTNRLQLISMIIVDKA
jgi:ABC-type bacteriocin/lantibiotic exporter with double-glycine peptidase domain